MAARLEVEGVGLGHGATRRVASLVHQPSPGGQRLGRRVGSDMMHTDQERHCDGEDRLHVGLGVMAVALRSRSRSDRGGIRLFRLVAVEVCGICRQREGLSRWRGTFVRRRRGVSMDQEHLRQMEERMKGPRGVG